MRRPARAARARIQGEFSRNASIGAGQKRMAAQRMHLLAVALLLPTAGSVGSVGSVGAAQRALHETGAIRNLHPQWQPEAVPWLSKLQTPPVLAELAALATTDNETLFRPNWDPTGIESQADDSSDWLALSLLNKGQLQPSGCNVAPETCAVLAGLAHHLQPRPPAAAEVGVRIIALQPGARLRSHHGPGGRLVAHLGIRIPPTGASLTLDGEQLGWAEGEWTVFDDSFLHSAENLATTPRYILHVTFPHPDIVPPLVPVPPVLPDACGPPPPPSVGTIIASTNSSHMRLDFFSNCSVQVTNLRNQSLKSIPEPLLTLYNKVADNQESDWDVCTAATAPADGTLRITAPHGYGTLDIGFAPFDAWVTFQLKSIKDWQGDPTQRHIKFAKMCPADICPVAGTYSVPGVGGRTVNGLFQGFRGAEGEYPDSTGFLTISSDWEHANEMYFVKQGWKLAYTLAPTQMLPKIWQGVRANNPEIPKPNKNRARTWYWAGGNASTLDDTIALAKSMGIELIFFGSFMNNIGDYTSDPVRWPNGLGKIRDRIHAAGLQIGLHILSPGSTVCLDQMQGCKGNIHIDTDVSRNHPEMFVPQGPAPRDWYWANSAGTWYCHEQSGKHCHDTSKNSYLQPGPGHPHAAPPSNPILLVGNVTWSKLGRYREGGAILFDGTNSSYGDIEHTDEYNFTHNPYYPTAKSEFTLQMTIHPVGPTVGRVQVLADKCDKWQLRINEKGQVEWHVHLVSDGPGDIAVNPWTFAKGTRVLEPGNAYVIKATHAGGTLKIFTCLLGDNFECDLGPGLPGLDGTAHGECSECKQFWSNGTAITSGPLAEPSRVQCLYDEDKVGGNIIVGAEQNAKGNGADKGFNGAMEEIFLSKLSLENITAHLYSCPGCGCNNFYICERDAAMLAYHAHCWTFRLLPALPQEACLALIMTKCACLQGITRKKRHEISGRTARRRCTTAPASHNAATKILRPVLCCLLCSLLQYCVLLQLLRLFLIQ
jgi:hypothetical protein